MMNFAEGHQQRFPPRVTGDPPVNWSVEMLPFSDQGKLYEDYNHGVAWDGPENAFATTLKIEVLRCPDQLGTKSGAGVETAYAVPHGTDGIISPERTLPMDKIGDGLSQTLLLVEASGQHIVWTEPRDVDFDQLPIGINLPGK